MLAGHNREEQAARAVNFLDFHSIEGGSHSPIEFSSVGHRHLQTAWFRGFGADFGGLLEVGEVALEFQNPGLRLLLNLRMDEDDKGLQSLDECLDLFLGQYVARELREKR